MMTNKIIKRLMICLMLLAAGMVFIIPAAPAHAQIEDQFVYLPMIILPQLPCGMNTHELALSQLMQNDPAQQRPFMQCDPILVQVARSHAEDMATRGFYSHINPEGLNPSGRVQLAGYLLPDLYLQDTTANYIEAMTALVTSPQEAWQVVSTSANQQMLVLGIDDPPTEPFYILQTDFGIGYVYAPGSLYTHYWVILTAHH